jgi:hypothetical protein
MSKLPYLGERYVYKFVCDPDALFQMALAENHRNVLKAEAASVLTKVRRRRRRRKSTMITSLLAWVAVGRYSHLSLRGCVALRQYTLLHTAD